MTKTMPRKLVLGHPYHGALYWLASAESWRRTPLKSAPKETHPYYKTLYGRAPHAVVDETVSLCLLYEEIYLAPADCPLPDFQSKIKGGRYHHDDLGILSDWDWERDRLGLDKMIKAIASDFTVQDHLKAIPPGSQEQIVRTAIVQLYIREIFGADLMASPSHMRLCDRIAQLLGMAKPGPPSGTRQLVAGLKAAFDVSSLRFSIQNLNEFVALRQSKSLRQYGASFRNVIDALPSGEDVEYALYKAMTEAMNRSDIAGHVSGGLNITATLSGIASLIPVVGTIASAIGLGADGTSKLASRIQSQQKWWALAPEISAILTRQRIEARYKALEKLRGQ
jgi:hypothetical protein